MFKRTPLSLAVAALVVFPIAAMAEIEVSGYAKNETSAFTSSGQMTGQGTTRTDTATANDAGDLMKFENSVRLFVNGDLGEESSFHADINMIYDSKGVNSDYKGHRNYTQNDWIRELYVDTTAGDWDFRIGKQQEVWGTADGIKLLDIINPTDFRELNQNTMEDARIPVFMVKGESDVGENGNVQFVISQAEENKIAGLNANGDSGHAFIMKGVDSITGQVNGFLNVAPELATVSGAFFAAYGSGPVLNSVVNMTVQNYVDGAGGGSAANLFGVVSATGAITNLMDGTSWDQSDPNSAFEYMSNASFSTFDTFVGATSTYRVDRPDDPVNLGLRFRNSTDSGLNYSLNYLYAYDSNPSVGIHWENSSGEKLSVVKSVTSGITTVDLQDSASNTYGGVAGLAPILVFEEKHYRSHYLGTSFDTAVETKALGPVVLRGEFLYQNDARVPVVNRTNLGHGDLVGGLTVEKADMFKYVLGADITVGTNLMISGQFIQAINLDFVDDRSGCTEVNCGSYTGDAATLHLTNGLQKGEEVDNFLSLFFSKPFGESQLGRWNNITIYEEGGGWWNRFDVEYSFSDQLVGTAELNTYWGDENTTFGQFEESSNIQLGIKYLFD
ncbi:MAG: RNA polymerase-associated protein rapA [Candidatus Sedimenticola sp. (ex Thyasira tokunagai)]